MGMYDTVWVKCPKCGLRHNFQSKAGVCDLVEYTLENAPPAVIGDLAEATTICDNCGAMYSVKVKILAVPAIVRE